MTGNRTLVALLVSFMSLGYIIAVASQPPPVVTTMAPIVNVERKVNESNTVSVQVPSWVDFVNHNNLQTNWSRVDLNVMNGLVTVNTNKSKITSRENNAQTANNGPIVVTVFGIPIFQGNFLQ